MTKGKYGLHKTDGKTSILILLIAIFHQKM